MIHLDDIALTVIRTLSLQSLYSLILFPVIWGLVRCSRGKYPQWQHGLWLLILIRLVLPPDAAFTWSAGNLIQSYSPQIVSGPSSERFKTSFNFHDNQNVPAVSFSNESLQGSKNTQTPVRHRTSIFSSLSFGPFCFFAFCIWLTITTFLIVRFLQKRYRFWKIALNGEKLIDPDVLYLAEVWRKRLYIRRKIVLKSDASNGSPFTIGLFRPFVVLPKHLLSPPGNSALESVLTHELVHVKRWDDFFITFQEILRIVYFFNPVVWYIMPRLTWTREASCDAAVLSYGTISPKNYGRQIVAFLKTQSITGQLSRNLAGFTSAARGMAFRLISIQKEENMKSHRVKTYLAIFLIGIFLLPMSPVISSSQSNTEGIKPEVLPEVQDKILRQTGGNPLTQYISNSVECHNPYEVSFILWGDKITENFQKEDFSRLAAATDFDIVDNIGNGQKAYVFYLLGSSRRGVYRPNFHFLKKQDKLILVYKSHNVSAYITDQPKINGLYQIAEGWRADFFNGTYDDRVKLAWGSKLWFWTGEKYLSAYTDYTVKNAIDPSLLGTKRVWNSDTKSLYQAAPRK